MTPHENHPQQTNTEKQARMASPANGPKILYHPMTPYIGQFRSSKTTIDDARKKGT
jgi:hypothetical protein